MKSMVFKRYSLGEDVEIRKCVSRLGHHFRDPLIEDKHASEVLAAKPPNFSCARIRNSLPQCALT